MSGMIDKEFRPLAKKLRKLGYRIEHRGGKHPKVYRPVGTFLCPLPTSSSDRMAVIAKTTELRRMGVPV